MCLGGEIIGLRATAGRAPIPGLDGPIYRARENVRMAFRTVAELAPTDGRSRLNGCSPSMADPGVAPTQHSPVWGRLSSYSCMGWADCRDDSPATARRENPLSNNDEREAVGSKHRQPRVRLLPIAICTETMLRPSQPVGRVAGMYAMLPSSAQLGNKGSNIAKRAPTCPEISVYQHVNIHFRPFSSLPFPSM